MIDLMALLTAPGAVPGSPSLPGLALGREEGGFDAVLDQVVAQIAAMLVPGASTETPATPSLPTFCFAPPELPGNPENADSAGVAVAPNSAQTVLAAMTVALPKMPTVVTPVAVEVPALVGEVEKSETPVVKDDAPKAATEQADPTAALVAAIRVGLGLPTPASPAASPAAVPSAETNPKKILPEHAVAVGRIGQMPTLPDHAHATLPMPAGIERRFTLPTIPAVPTTSTTTPTVTPATPVVPPAPTPIDVGPVTPTASEKPESVEPSMPLLRNDTPVAPRLPDAPAFPGLPEMPDVPVTPLVMTDAPAMPIDVPSVVFESAVEVALPEMTTMTTQVAASVDRPEMTAMTNTPVVAASVDDIVRPVALVAEPANDIAVPDVAPTGVPVDESVPSEIRNAQHTPMPVFDETPPTEEERLSAIALPLVSSSEEAADNNDTIDTLAVPHDESTPPQQAAAVNQTDTARPERAGRNERAHEANGLAAPLRAALRDRDRTRRDDGFELTVRLDPPELGAVRVRVFTQGDNVRVTLHAENPEARAVLQQRQDDVRDLLRNEGFNLDGFDVESHDERHQANEQSNRRQNRNANEMAHEFVAPVLEDDGALRL